MVRKSAVSFLCCSLLFSVPVFEKVGSAADVETNGDLTVTGTIESTSGGVKFPDSTVQTTAYTGSAGGVNITSPDGSISVGGTSQAPTVAVNSVSASRITGSLPVSQVSGAATTGANSFTGTQSISSGNLALPSTTASTSGVITLGGVSFVHAYGNWNTFVGSGAGNFGMTGPGGNVGVGQSALVSDTTGSNNVAVGFHSLLNNTTGSTNTAVGGAALYNNISGSGNTASGGSALVFNTSGNNNTAIGDMALYNNKGDSNTALGYSAGYSQTTGGNNIYIGYYVQGVDGENNTIRIGNGTTQAYIAGTVNATGFSGNGSGLTNLSASAVTGAVPVANGGTGATTAASALANLGAVSLTGSYTDPAWITSLAGSRISGNISGNAANVTGIVAIANGGTGAANASAARSNLGVPGLAITNVFSAGLQTIATGAAGNIALLVQGAASQSANLQEWRNSGGTAIASISSAGDLTTSGNINLPATTATSGLIKSNGSTFIHSFGTSNYFAGVAAGNLTMSGDTNTASGVNALHANTSGSLNTATGANALKVNAGGAFNTATGTSALISNNGGMRNTATGTYALQDNIGGNYNTATGYESLFLNTSGSGNTACGTFAGQTITTGSNNTFVGYSADAQMYMTALTDATAIGANAVVDDSYHIRIGDTSITQIGGQVAWSNLSDIRVKEDVQEIGQGLAFIKELRPVEFRMKKGNGRKDFGFIAQDIEALLGTEYNVLGIGADTERTLSLRYTDFIAPLVKAMQEQQEMIESQNETIKIQREKILSLEDRLASIESMLVSK